MGQKMPIPRRNLDQSSPIVPQMGEAAGDFPSFALWLMQKGIDQTSLTTTQRAVYKAAYESDKSMYRVQKQRSERDGKQMSSETTAGPDYEPTAKEKIQNEGREARWKKIFGKYETVSTGGGSPSLPYGTGEINRQKTPFNPNPNIGPRSGGKGSWNSPAGESGLTDTCPICQATLPDHEEWCPLAGGTGNSPNSLGGGPLKNPGPEDLGGGVPDTGGRGGGQGTAQLLSAILRALGGGGGGFRA